MLSTCVRRWICRQEMALYTPPPGTETSMCMVCGISEGVSKKLIRIVRQPGWMWFLLPVAPIPALILGGRAEIQHRLFVPFCSRCARRQRLSSILGLLGLGASIVATVFAVVLGVSNESWTQAITLLSLASALGIASGLFRKRAFPRYSTLTPQRVEIEVPGKGRFVIFPT